MKRIITCLFFIAAIFSQKLNAQEKYAIINLAKNYEAGLTEDSYFQVFSLPQSVTQKQIDELKQKSLNYNYVKEITISQVGNGYEVRLLLDKKSESISGYFRDYLLFVSILKVELNGELVNTNNYYSAVSKILNNKEKK